MSHPYIYHDFVLREVIPKINAGVLDIGCGKGIWGYLVRTLHNGQHSYIIGLDLNRDLLRFNKKYRVYDELLLCDCAYLPFRSRFFNLVLGIEVIEHLTKQNGNQLLNEVERVSNEQGKIVITTPNGFWRQDAVEGRASEIHLSGWTVYDFRQRGYTVHGIGFRAAMRFKSGIIQVALTYILTPLSYIFPGLGFLLIATKRPNPRRPIVI